MWIFRRGWKKGGLVFGSRPILVIWISEEMVAMAESPLSMILKLNVVLTIAGISRPIRLELIDLKLHHLALASDTITLTSLC